MWMTLLIFSTLFVGALWDTYIGFLDCFLVGWIDIFSSFSKVYTNCLNLQFLTDCMLFVFKAHGKASKIFQEAGKFYKFSKDVGKILHNFPCMVPEVSKLIKKSKMIPACLSAHQKNSCDLNPGCEWYKDQWRIKAEKGSYQKKLH